ncbi:MAG: hypothetical protein PHP99_04610 [Paludibacter sp.]|nr:hypothetical protein [Paludibacter sp.]
MRKLFTLFSISLFLILNADAQNLINYWNGFNATTSTYATGEGSQPKYWGWSTNPATADANWITANGGSSIRYMDNLTGYDPGRIMFMRWDGVVNTSGKYYFKLDSVSVDKLTAGNAYVFTWSYAWHNNASAPTITTSIVKGRDGSEPVSVLTVVGTDATNSGITQTFPCSTTKMQMRTGSITFIPPTDGDYYISFGSNTASLCVIRDLSLVNKGNEYVELLELQKQTEELTLGDVSAVESNIILPTTLGTKGVTVSWVSNKPEIIDNQGNVTRPEKYNKIVKLTATISIPVQDTVYSNSKSFNVTVLGVEPTPVHIAAFDFSTESISLESDTLRVTDTQSGFKGKLMNEARIRTIGSTEHINVLDLGNGTGYFDMGQEIGKAIYSLQDYTMMGFYRVDEANTNITAGGNYYWNFSNSADVGKYANGFMYGRLNAHAAGISAAGSPSIATNPNQAAQPGAWHHFAYSQNGTVGTVYVDGVQVAQKNDMPVTALTIAKDSLVGTICNWLGRSGWVNDAYLKQTLLYDFRVYSVPLSANDIADGFDGFDPVISTKERLDNAYAENPDYVAAELQTEYDQLTLGDLSNVTANIELPSKGKTDETVLIKWSSSNPALIDANGVVTRPDYFSYKVKLTALLLKNGQNMTKTFDATVAVKEGTQFTNSLLVKHDFANYTYPDTVVYDAAEKGFRAELRNDAKIYTMGTTNQYKVLNLGDSIGYLDMGPEVGKVIYNLNDYTMSAYYRIEADTTLLKDPGHFLWTFSNTDDAMKDRNGYIIGSLLDQSVSISPKFYEATSGNQALGYATPALKGDWHHFAYVQSGTSASIYIDGMSMGTAEITNLPSEVLPQPGRLGTLYNWIGRSNYITDKYLRKTLVHDFRIYNRALTDNEILTTELNVGEVIASLNTAYSEGLTGVKDVKQSADKYRIFASEGKIKVTGLDARDKVEVFDIAGRKIKSAVQSEIAVKPGLYIVKVNTQVTKVIVK